MLGLEVRRVEADSRMGAQERAVLFADDRYPERYRPCEKRRVAVFLVRERRGKTQHVAVELHRPRKAADVGIHVGDFH